MKFTITKDHLVDALAAAGAVVSPKTTLPVLANILVEAAKDTVRFTGTDLDITLAIAAPADVATAGAVTVPARKLMELVKELEDKPVTLSVTGDRLTITCGQYEGKMVTLPKDEFPALPPVVFGSGTKLAGAALRGAIGDTAWATSTEESRPILNGVCWKWAGDTMTMAATDGHRLARRVEPVAVERAADLIVPPKALEQVKKLCIEDGDVEVATTDNYVGFQQGRVTIYARLIEGPYPNYEQVIPKDNNKVAIFELAPLAQLLKRMAVLANPQTNKVQMALNGAAKFTTETADLGAADDELSVDYQGDPLEIAFNVKYALAVLSRISSDRVRMTFKAAERAMVMEPVVANGESPKSTFLLMPLRINA